MSLGVGEVFAGYTIVRQIGNGGMGEVYLAQHPRLSRQEALKVLRPEISRDDSFRQRFIREADSIAALEHPNIVTAYDRGDTDNQLWISTQYIEGTDAARLLRSRYPAGMPADEVADIVTAIAAALDYAHNQGLLHRDVKPANILLSHPDQDGHRRTYLADFGIARPLDDPAGLTATGFTVGTIAYASPEQLAGGTLDGRSDQYALAATAYQLLTGTTPFPNTNPIAIISAHLTRTPPPPSTVHPALAPFDALFARGLAKNPEDRFGRCQDFAQALTAAAATTGSYSATAPTRQAPKPPTVGLTPRRKLPRLVPITAAGIAAAAVLFYTGSKLGENSPSSTQSAPTPTTASSSAVASSLSTATATNAPPAPSTTTPQPATPTNASLPVSGGAAYVITPAGKTACRVAGARIDCYVQFNATAAREIIDGKPMTGVSFSPDGSIRWLTADRGDHDYTTLEYGSVYQALNWTVKSYKQGTIFTNDVTGMGMMISAQGFTTIQPGSPADQRDVPTEGRPCTDKDKIVPAGNGEMICEIVSTGPFVLQWRPFTKTGLELATRGASCAPIDVSGDFRLARSTDDYLVWCVGYPGNPKWTPVQP